MSQSITDFAICEDKNIESHELANLFASVGWGDDKDYQPGIISRSIAAYPLVAYCRDSNGLLISYVSAFISTALPPSRRRINVGAWSSMTLSITALSELRASV